MFIALDAKKNRWNCVEKVPDPSLGPFSCLICRKVVRLKKGKVMRPHFAHVTLADCPLHHESESQEHIELKASLYRWGKEETKAEVESYLPEFQQIADLLFPDQKLALEVQCSSLSLKRLRERSDAYRKHGYQVYWLLGEKLWLKKSLSALQEGLVYFSQNRGFHLWELDLRRQEVRLHYLIHQDLRGHLHYKTQFFPFYETSLLEVFRTPFARQGLQHLRVPLDLQFKDYLRQQLYYQHPKWMALQEKLYLKGKNLLELDLEDFYPLCRPLKSSHFIQIRGDWRSYYQDFMTYYRRTGMKATQTLYSPRFYQNGKA